MPKRTTKHKKVVKNSQDMVKMEFREHAVGYSSRVSDFLMKIIFSLGGNNALLAPIQFEEQHRNEKLWWSNYGVLLGFDDKESEDLMMIVEGDMLAFTSRHVFWFPASLGIILLIFIPYWNYLHEIDVVNTTTQSLSLLGSTINTSLVLFSVLALGLISLTITFRLSSLLIDRKYSRSICAVQCFYILFELKQKDVLLTTSKKEKLLRRVDYLAKKVLLIGLNYPGNDSATKVWAQNHFRKIEKYIREKEKWIIAPTSETIETLQNDFFDLAKTFLNANFGELALSDDIDTPEIEQQSQFGKIGFAILRFIGIVLPIVLMISTALVPELYKSLGIENKTISMLAIAWLLLAIDNTLKLGVAERLVNLAKAFKEI